MIIAGLCGVGETVLLDVCREKAETRGWATVEWEIEKKTPFAPKVAAQARKALLRIAPKARWKDRISPTCGRRLPRSTVFLHGPP